MELKDLYTNKSKCQLSEKGFVNVDNDVSRPHKKTVDHFTDVETQCMQKRSPIEGDTTSGDNPS